MANNLYPVISIVIFGGTDNQKKEMVKKITNLYPANRDYELLFITNKKNYNTMEVIPKKDFYIKAVCVKKGSNALNQISTKILKVSRTNYFLFQNVNEDLYNLNKFIDLIKKNPFNNKSKSIIAFTMPTKPKDKYLVEDAPYLFINKEISNIVFSRPILEYSVISQSQYEWKIQTLLNSQYILINSMENENSNIEDISMYFQKSIKQLNKFSSFLNQLNINEYSKKTLFRNLFEQIVSSQISILYKKVIKEKKGIVQVEFLKQIEEWLKVIDIQILSLVPAIRYYFIRWSIDNYSSLSYLAKRQHLKILKYIIKNMHFDSYQVYMKKHNKLFPAAIMSTKLNSIIPIYIYLIKRKLKKLIIKNKKVISNKQYSINH